MAIPLDRKLLQRLADFFAAQEVEVYLVGGTVRDWLLGRASQDLDLAVTGDALALTRRLADHLNAAYVLLDADHPTARAVLRRPAGSTRYIDVAQWRADTLEGDLAARDFTVNAMAIELRDALSGDVTIIDPLGGQEDLGRRQLRAISERPFQDDPLRLLRAVRLAAELDFTIEPETQTWIRRHAESIAKPSAERVRDELVRLFARFDTARYLRLLDDLGLLAPLLPELVACKGVTQPPSYHAWDVFDHSLMAVERLEVLFESLDLVPTERSGPSPDIANRSLLHDKLEPFSTPLREHLRTELVKGRPRYVLLKLLTLLHDVGKPQTRSVDEEGAIHFYRHEWVGAAMVGRILRRLRFGAREVNTARTVIRHHMRPKWLANAEELSNRAVYRFFRDTGAAGIDVALLSLADLLAQHPQLDAQALERQLAVTQRLLTAYYQDRRLVEPPQLVRGDDLMKEFGLEEGPLIGELLEAIREAQAVGTISTRDEALELARQALRSLAIHDEQSLIDEESAEEE